LISVLTAKAFTGEFNIFLKAIGRASMKKEEEKR
jgi:hypothetical protein